MSPPDEPADLSMLDFFLSELAEGAGAIQAGLTDLLDGRACAAEASPGLVRAAGSIKAAARIAGVDDVFALARAMEEVFLAARGLGHLPGHDADASLLAATAVFLRLSRREAADIPQAVQAEAEGMADLATVLGRAAHEPSGASSEEPGGTMAAPDPAPAETPDKAAAPGPVPAASRTPADSHADLSMLDLFRMELETNAAVLDAGLVALEADQRPELVEPLMRAAHSVKGAARIVGLGAAVELAHAMEDLLEACRQGRLHLTPGHIDLLLAGNDVFSRLAGHPAGEIPAGLAAMADRIAQVRGLLEACPAEPGASPPAGTGPAADSGPAAVQAATSPPPERTPPAGTCRDAPTAATAQGGPAEAGNTAGDSLVRISAANLNRFMGLAGECLVEARSLASLSGIFQRLKAGQDALSGVLSSLRESVMTGEVSHNRPEAPDGGAADGCDERLARAGRVLAESREVLAQGMERFDLFSRRLENLSDRLYNEVVDSRMRRFSDGLHGFPRMVRDLARELEKRVSFTVAGRSTKVDREILERLEAPLNHLLRNALDHGIEAPEERARLGKPETGVLTVAARHFAGMLSITVTDDGRGLDPERIRAKVLERGLASPEMAAALSDAELMDFLFLPGFTTAGKVTEISGRGVGLDVVHAMVRDVGGQVRAESRPGQGMTFHLRLPLTLSVVRTLLVDVAGEPYAVPLTRIDRILSLAPEEISELEGRQYCVFEGDTVGLAPAWRVLGAREAAGPARSAGGRPGLPVVVISDRLNRYGMVVEDFLGERDLVVKPLDPRLGKVPCVSAASVMEDGAPVLILDVDDMVRAVDNLLGRGRLDRVGEARERQSVRTRRILVVDDSLTVRETQRRLLSNRGYAVETAVDGMDGLHALRGHDFDLVITDVDMPRVSGIELVRRIRADARLAALPVMIVSYKDREEDRLQGLHAGADYYLGKGSFQDQSLLDAVADLIGEPEA
jgi:two-component system sensor histidine kinase and response regulator WspE